MMQTLFDCKRLSIEFQRKDPTIAPADYAEKISTVLLKPWREINGKVVTISNSPPHSYIESNTHKRIAQIFFGFITLITAPFVLLGLGLAALSQSHKVAYRNYI